LEQSSASYVDSPTLEGIVRADVAVIGGGFTGLSTAWHLKKTHPGLRVVLLEANVVGFGASGRNAGMLLPQFGLTLSNAVQHFGRQKTQDAMRYVMRAVEYTGQMVRAHDLDCDYEYPGLLRVATSPEYAQRIIREMELAQSLDIATGVWIDADAARALVDSPTFMGARVEAHCGLLNPAKLARELKRIATGLGVEIYEHSPVTDMAFSDPIRAQTPHGSVQADKLVLATNAFSAQFPQLRDRQCPLHLYIILTEPLNDEQLDSLAWRGRQGVMDARNLAHFYRLTPDNRLLVGGGDARYYYDNATDVDKHTPTFQRLQWFVAETFPALHGLKISHRWGGPISATFDLAPSIGAIGADQRIVYSIGCAGFGVAPAILNGATMSDLISETHSDLTDVFFVNRSVTKLPPEPLRALLVNGYLSFLRMQDTLYDLK
jgi:glycine/D-amino acid oxidase-like deaminating enzyme